MGAECLGKEARIKGKEAGPIRFRALSSAEVKQASEFAVDRERSQRSACPGQISELDTNGIILGGSHVHRKMLILFSTETVRSSQSPSEGQVVGKGLMSEGERKCVDAKLYVSTAHKSLIHGHGA